LLCDTRTADDYDVQTSQLFLPMAKTFTHLAFYTVSGYGGTRRLACYHQAKTGCIPGIGSGQYRHPAITCLALAVIEYPPILGGSRQASLSWETRQAVTQERGFRRTAAPGPWHDVR
jgi:hypothetical protein